MQQRVEPQDLKFPTRQILEIMYIYASANIQEEAPIPIIWVRGNVKWITRKTYASFVRHTM